jgi:hypothetical protein
MAGKNHQERNYDRTAETPVQSRTLAKLESKREKERLTRKEKSMADAKAALAETYAKYGIKPLSEKPKPKMQPSRMLEFKRKQLTPEQAARINRWLERRHGRGA